MIFTTHVGIARLVQRELKKEFGINLHLQGFIYGNVRPDLKPDYFNPNKGQKIGHFVWEALDFVIDSLYELQDLIDRDIDIEKQTFAIKLGHIMHYFSDFFCYAHTLDYTKSLSEHLLYEFRLSNYFTQSETLTKKTIQKPAAVHSSVQTLIAHFKSMQRDYLSQPPSMKKDIEYTLYFVKSLCYSVAIGFNSKSESISA